MTPPSPAFHHLPVIVWGFGSIGRRHARLLRDLGCNVAVITRQDQSEFPQFASIEVALTATEAAYCVIATPTAEHISNLTSLAACGYTGKVLVEKPLSQNGESLPAHAFAGIHVGYNLRFHPVVQAARDRLRGQKTYAASWHVGQYLPDWRPGTDYRQSYSARKSSGGGVLRDLSHELDLALWMHGPWQRAVALASHVSSLAIQSEDAASLLLICTNCPQLTIHLNYLDRNPVRQFIITTADITVVGDLVGNTLTCAGKTETFPTRRDHTYVQQHEAILRNEWADLCSTSSAQDVVSLIVAAEQSVADGHWKSHP